MGEGVTDECAAERQTQTHPSAHCVPTQMKIECILGVLKWHSLGVVIGSLFSLPVQELKKQENTRAHQGAAVNLEHRRRNQQLEEGVYEGVRRHTHAVETQRRKK